MYPTDFEELRTICRKHIESMEHWARRLIHEKLNNKYGNNYFYAENENGENIINKAIRTQAERLIKENPQRFPRHVDTLFLDDIITILCQTKFYKVLFKEALDINYPQGKEEVREFLGRIIPIRNALSHSNPISMRQAEQAICYCNDFVFSLREYYRMKGLESVWNVPQIIKVIDSLGNVFYPNAGGKANLNGETFNIRDKNGTFRIGDTYTISLEMDPSFQRTEYIVKWYDSFSKWNNKSLSDSLTYSKTFTENDVNINFQISAWVVSSKKWHKFNSHDDDITINASVLPPM